jgi:hypothetical protein
VCPFTTLLLVAFLLTTLQTACAADVGFQAIEIPDGDEKPLDAGVWYRPRISAMRTTLSDREKRIRARAARHVRFSAMRKRGSRFPVLVGALNEFSDANNDQCRWNEYRLRTQCPENARARESCNCPPEAVFRNPAFDYVVRHH